MGINVNSHIVSLYLLIVLNCFINLVLSLNRFSSRKKVKVGTNIPNSVKRGFISNTSF